MNDGMPWGGIAKRTAQITAVVAVTVFVGLTGMCAAALHQERLKKAESERTPWTDAARWERT